MENNNHIHNFECIKVEPTCQEKGYTLHKCECGYEHKDNFIPAGNHSFKLSEETNPTCIANGTRKFICSVCGEERIESIAPLGHKLTMPKESETQKGYIDYFCENCGQTITEPAPLQKAKNGILAHKKAIIISFTSIILAVGLFFATTMFFIPYYHYSKATELMDEANYTEAYHHLKKCAGFKDSNKKLKDFVTICDAYIVMYKDGNVRLKYEYDENGNKTLMVKYDQDGNVSYKYEYNENGNITREIQYDPDGNVRDKFEAEYEYDENGNKTLMVKYDQDGNVMLKHEYDENGNKTLEIQYDQDGNARYKYAYEYNKNGNITLVVGYDQDGNVLDKFEAEYEYDENGNKTFAIQYDQDGNVLDTFGAEYEYDENGNITLEIQYDQDGNVAEKIEYINPRVIYKPINK